MLNDLTRTLARAVGAVTMAALMCGYALGEDDQKNFVCDAAILLGITYQLQKEKRFDDGWETRKS